MPSNGRRYFGIWNTVQIGPHRIFQRIVSRIRHGPFKRFAIINFDVVIGLAGLKTAREHISDILSERRKFRLPRAAVIAKCGIANVVFKGLAYSV